MKDWRTWVLTIAGSLIVVGVGSSIVSAQDTKTRVVAVEAKVAADQRVQDERQRRIEDRLRRIEEKLDRVIDRL